jgi:hypothetical protein
VYCCKYGFQSDTQYRSFRHRSPYSIIVYWSGSSSRHFLRFLSNIFKKQSRNLCFTPLLFCMNHNDLPTKWIFIKESARWSGIHYYDVAIFNRKWPQQKQFSPTFRNIVFCEAKPSKRKKNDILENWNPFLKRLPVFVLVCRKLW